MKKLILFIDGGAISNPGPAAVGFLICNQRGEILKKYSQFLGDNFTNNQAEYLALILALKKVKQLFGNKLAKETEIEVKGDSALVFNQLNGKYKVLDEKIKNLFIEAWNLKQDFKSVKLKLIRREKNKEADKLVKEALKEHGFS